MTTAVYIGAGVDTRVIEARSDIQTFVFVDAEYNNYMNHVDFMQKLEYEMLCVVGFSLDVLPDQCPLVFVNGNRKVRHPSHRLEAFSCCENAGALLLGDVVPEGRGSTQADVVGTHIREESLC